MTTGQSKGLLADIFARGQSVGGTAAALALIITITICARCYFQPSLGDPPPLLSHSLSVILGFYFGSRVVHRADSQTKS